MRNLINLPLLILLSFIYTACENRATDSEGSEDAAMDESGDTHSTDAIAPLITDLYTADPSAHVFEGKLYLYPSHDYESGVPEDDLGSHFDMKDYHVYSMEEVGGEITDHGVVLSVDEVPWADKQMWAPDAAEKDGTYYFYFPAKDDQGIFRIGVATASEPYGPFEPEQNPIEGSFSIDPAVFEDSDGAYYMYFGGIWGGQLQKWRTGEYVSTDSSPYADEPAEDEPAIAPRVARLSEDMLQFAEEPQKISILDQNGNPILAGDHDRRFFEAAWVHKYNDKYYFSYSTGDTHNIAYAIGDSPYGPFTYQGVILNPVLGWTNHHSIVEYKGQWYLFFHDSELSGGKTHLRNVKVTELTHNEDGSIRNIDALAAPRDNVQ